MDNEESSFEVVEVYHQGKTKHTKILSLEKGYNDRCTWCSRCGIPVIWTRTNPIEGYKSVED
jgi:hypothetical protein